ncbi:MAG: SGNH/GDSL hydrolase family protein [Lachnospiraceae bacterium]|nr:SGNH/GDSL hydrolase family protein [Lachnospiraceae bacterium]
MKFKRFINMHTLLLLAFLLMIGGIVYRFFHWGIRVDPDNIITENRQDEPDTFDLFLPLMDKDGSDLSTGKKTETIVCFGNSPFADDRDSKDNLANMIAEQTGATVYNCSITGSFLAAGNYTIEPWVYPLDSYNFYWLTQVAVKGEAYTRCGDAERILGDATPPEAREVYDTLWNLDFKDVDAIVIMYDASDYLDGHAMYDDNNSTNIECFTGNLEAGIELLQNTYPWVRIIVMSPTYAYAVDERGKYVSSDLYTYGWDILSTYVIKEAESCFNRSVSFVDNFYGTINEDHADKYLVDNLHLNKAGRKLVAERCVQALTYYDDAEE